MASASVTDFATSDRQQAVVTRFAPSRRDPSYRRRAYRAVQLAVCSHRRQVPVAIEDTDRVRSTDAAIDAIFDGLSWLGLGGDEEPCSSLPGPTVMPTWRTSFWPPAMPIAAI
jgi:glutamyl-tRNA synthetase